MLPRYRDTASLSSFNFRTAHYHPLSHKLFTLFNPGTRLVDVDDIPEPLLPIEFTRQATFQALVNIAHAGAAITFG
jgi:hypothetical protein